MGDKINYTGQDTIIIGGIIVDDDVAGDVLTLNFPANIFDILTGKDGNGIATTNFEGQAIDGVLRVLRGGRTDKFLQTFHQARLTAPVGTPLISGYVAKKLGGATEAFTLLNGTTKQLPVLTVNNSGDAEQAMATWQLKFSKAIRAFV